MKFAISILICISQLLGVSAVAQCNASFTYTAAESKVSFFPASADTLHKTHQWYFGDSSSSLFSYPSHHYSLPGKYEVRHIIYDSVSSCIDSSWQAVTVKFTPDCSVAFQYYNSSVYRNQYNFFASPSTAGGTTQFTWRINDSIVGTTPQLYYWFPKVGSYKVCVALETSYGCTAENCQQINIVSIDSCPLGQASFVAKKDTTNGLRFNFKPQPDSSGYIYNWDFGDGSISAERYPAHAFGRAGYYFVRLTVYSSNRADSCSSTAYNTVYADSASKQCNVAVEAYADNSNRGRFYFYANTHDAIKSSLWKINDSPVSTDNNFSYNFRDTGYYNVCVRIETQAGCVAENCIRQYVSNLDSCKPLNPTFITIADNINPLKIAFHSVNDSAYSYYQWSFGDSTYSNGISPVHTYAKPGVYTVILQVRGNTADSCLGSVQMQITVSAKPDSCHLPIPSFVASADSTNPLLFHFAQTPPPPNYLSEWQFGDGTVSTSNAPSHLYNAPGIYSVVLKIKTGNNLDSCMASTTQQVVVKKDTVQVCIVKDVSFVASPSATNPLRVNFSPVPDSIGYSYEWRFDSNIIFLDKYPVITFNNPGIHTVSLLVKNNKADNCTGFVQHTINLLAPDTICSASFNWYADSSLAVSNKIHFVANSSQPFIAQQWKIYDVRDTMLAQLGQMNPVYSFTDTGYHKVCLKATAANGCIADYCTWVYIPQLTAQDTSQANTGNSVKVYPNPASNEVKFNLELNTNEQVRITIYNSQGMPVKQETRSGFAGTNQIKINIQTLQPGLYFSEIIFGSTRKTARFQKQ